VKSLKGRLKVDEEIRAVFGGGEERVVMSDPNVRHGAERPRRRVRKERRLPPDP
jgi:hypothetical protein